MLELPRSAVFAKLVPVSEVRDPNRSRVARNRFDTIDATWATSATCATLRQWRAMNVLLRINGKEVEVEAAPSELLLQTLRRLGYFGVKFGDEHGLTGSDTVLLDGRPVNAGSITSASGGGHTIATIEALGEHPQQGWRDVRGAACTAARLH